MSISRKSLCEALERRAKRLVHLIDISAPSQLISTEVMLIVQAAMGCHPEEITKVFANWLASVGRRDAGYCRSCDATLSPIEYQCPTCKETAEDTK